MYKLCRQRDKSVIIGILDEVLGVGTSLRGNEQIIVHSVIIIRKSYKLTWKHNNDYCWVCDSKGRKIQTLLKGCT